VHQFINYVTVTVLNFSRSRLLIRWFVCSQLRYLCTSWWRRWRNSF